MMNKTLLSLGLATAVVVSTGAAVAAAQDDGATTRPATVQAVDQDRDQLRDCDLYDGTADQARDRDRDPAMTSTDAVQVRQRVRAQEHRADGDPAFGRGVAADGAANGGFGDGVGDGTGPIHDGPADGTGRQLGRSGR